MELVPPQPVVLNALHGFTPIILWVFLFLKGPRGRGWTLFISVAPIFGAYLCEQMNGGSLMNYVLMCESQVAPLEVQGRSGRGWAKALVLLMS